MNSVTIIGNLTKEVELRATTSGISVCSFTLAVNRPHKKDETDFIACVVWRQGAEYLSKYSKKGDKIGVTGALTTRKWEDKDGNSRTAYEVTADGVEILTKHNNTVAQSEAEFIDLEEDELPFN